MGVGVVVGAASRAAKREADSTPSFMVPPPIEPWRQSYKGPCCPQVQRCPTELSVVLESFNHRSVTGGY